MNRQTCISKLEEIKAQLDQLEKKIAQMVKNEEASMGAVMREENHELGKKLAHLELAGAREKIRRYHVS